MIIFYCRKTAPSRGHPLFLPAMIGDAGPVLPWKSPGSVPVSPFGTAGLAGRAPVSRIHEPILSSPVR